MIESLTEEAARDALREVLDPETGLNLVDLGLIYGVTYHADTHVLDVTMTLTTPACPAGDVMTSAVERRMGLLPGVQHVDVCVTFDPPWTPQRISPEGRTLLGW